MMFQGTTVCFVLLIITRFRGRLGLLAFTIGTFHMNLEVSLLASYSLMWVFTMMCLLGTNNAWDGAAPTSGKLVYISF